VLRWAWLSDDNTDARDRIPDGQYQLIDFDQTIVADDLADLTDGSLDAPPNRDENSDVQQEFVWTGTRSDGTRAESNCSGWTINAGPPDDATAGASDLADAQWTDQGLRDCSEFLSFYCFSLTPKP
jgi:hypothetical protein